MPLSTPIPQGLGFHTNILFPAQFRDPAVPPNLLSLVQVTMYVA